MKIPVLLPSTVQLLRFHFSLFLMPIYWFALSQVSVINLFSSALVFFILHVLVYPASNGYNSYMDQDNESIGGVKRPLRPTRQLFHLTIAMDCAAILLSCLLSINFAVGVLLYILASKAYSYRGVRLKKYPIAGYLTVVIFQGAFTFALIYTGCSADTITAIPGLAMVAASLLIGGFYPLTQIYQHQADRRDGVKTISYLLGYRGTFIFCGIIYSIAFMTIGFYFLYTLQHIPFYIFCTGMLPVIIYFFLWAGRVWKNDAYADFEHTMRMNKTASVCSNLAFILIFIVNHFE